MNDALIFLIAGTLAAATPLLFAAMGELMVERCGVLNLGIEGLMATGAATAFVVATVTGSPWLGFAAAAAAAGLLACVFAGLVLLSLANQVACGLAVGILGLGTSVMIGKQYEGRTIKPLPSMETGPLADIPLFGPMFFEHDIMVYAGLVLVVLTWWFLRYARAGLVVRAIGESPAAADALGYPVRLIRFAAIVYGGMLAGIGGACLTLAYTPLWAEGLVAGRGWIVVALVVFGTWRALPIAMGAWLFGAVSLLELFIQGQGFALPSQLLSASPYLITILILVIISRNPRWIRLNHPASLGTPYRRQD